MPIYEAVKTDGALRLVPGAAKAYAEYVKALGDGETRQIVVREPKRQRSYDQLRYWFGVPMKILSEHTGYTKLQMHYLCLAVCFGVVMDQTTDREVPVVPASKHLSTKEFSELVEWVGPWAHETYGLEIPLPGQVDLSALPGVDESEVA